jgi:hypothetical protein
MNYAYMKRMRRRIPEIDNLTLEEFVLLLIVDTL